MKKFSMGLVALVAAVLMAAPAMAATDFDLYGQVRFGTFYEVNDLADTGSDTDLTWDLHTNARIGAIGKVDNMGYRWETGTSGGNANIRLLYGTWDFGQGTLLVGQNYAPYTWYSDQVWAGDNGFMGFGALHERRPMIQVKLKNGFHLTALKPDSTGLDLDSVTTGAQVGDVDTYMPKMVVGYDGAVDGFVYGAGLAYQRFDQEGGGFDESIDAYLLYHHGKLDAQPFEVIYNVHYGQNLGTVGLNIFKRDAEGARLVGNDVEDTTSYGAFAQVGYTLTETSRLHTGLAYIAAENDAFADDEERISAFVNAEIFLTKNFFMTPEITYVDNLERFNGQEGDLWAFGAKWQMNF